MCVEHLICKEKIQCLRTGNDVSVVFSMAGHSAAPITILATLLKTTGTYTMSLYTHDDVLVTSVTNQGTGAYQFSILKDLTLLTPDIYVLRATSTEEITLYELNMATLCLCDIENC